MEKQGDLLQLFPPALGHLQNLPPPKKKTQKYAFPKQSTSAEGKRNHQRFWLSLRAGVTQLKT